MATGNNLKRPPNINPSYEFLLLSIPLSWSLSFSSGFYLVYTWALLLLFLLLAACCLWLFFYFLKWWVGYLSVPTASRTTTAATTATTATTTRHNKLFATHDFSCNFEFKILHTLFSLCCFSSTRLTLPTPLTIRLPLARPALLWAAAHWPGPPSKPKGSKIRCYSCGHLEVLVVMDECVCVCVRGCVCVCWHVCVCAEGATRRRRLAITRHLRFYWRWRCWQITVEQT